MAKGNSAAAGWVVFFLLCSLVAAWLIWSVQRRQPPQPPTPVVVAAAPVTSVRVASWNIRQFTDRSDLDLRMVADIICDADIDVLAIQEVKKDGRAVDRLLSTLGPLWRGTQISPMTGNSERFAFIYRRDRVQQVGSAGSLPVAEPGVFDRLPYSATFRAGSFDFQLITVHLSYTDTGRRRLEARALADCVAQLATRQAEKDIFVLGDFNEQRSRPNMDFFNAAGWGVSIKEGTNLSSSQIYDNILFNARYTTEWRDAGVILFDEKYFGDDDKAAGRVSDHRPVYADFSASGPDDD